MSPYTETQNLRAGWLYLAMVFAFVVLIGSAYQESKLLSFSFLGAFILLLLLFGSLLAARLKLSFNPKGLQYRFWPFHWQTHEILWKDIEEIRLLDFNALAEYGGWGIRYNFVYKTKAFVARSGSGLLVKTRSGKKRLFSIRHPEKVATYLSLPEMSRTP